MILDGRAIATPDHASHELVRAVATVARVGEIALACCLTCRTILGVWPIGTAPAEDDQ